MSRIIKEIEIKEGTVWVDGEIVYTNEEKSIGLFLKGLYKHLGLKYGKFFKMDYVSKLGFLASEMLLSGQEDIPTDSDSVAIVLANSSASLNTDVKYQNSISEIPSPALFVYTLPNIVIGEISIKNKFYGEHMFFVQNQYDKAALQNYTNVLFDTTNTVFALTGWVEVMINGEYNAQLMLCAKN